jgi:hypothetical protein
LAAAKATMAKSSEVESMRPRSLPATIVVDNG